MLNDYAIFHWELDGPAIPIARFLEPLIDVVCCFRHGWGIDVDLPLAISYLSKAARNSSIIESEALASGMKKGGVAKGELVLAIFELGNCFRNGWGIDKDAVAARSYYETAANCGDIDAMVEVARCYEEGFGTKRDKFKAATYYRKAEESGNKIVGNSWYVLFRLTQSL